MVLKHLGLCTAGHTVGPLYIYIEREREREGERERESYHMVCVCVCGTHRKIPCTVYLYVPRTHMYEIYRELPCIVYYKLVLCDIKSLSYLLK